MSPNLPPASAPERDPHCDPEDGCVTCGDVAVPMRVLALDDRRGLALCATDQDRRETVEVALVAPVAVGDELLVHAGTAIAAIEAHPSSDPTAPPEEHPARNRNTPGREAEEVLR